MKKSADRFTNTNSSSTSSNNTTEATTTNQSTNSNLSLSASFGGRESEAEEDLEAASDAEKAGWWHGSMDLEYGAKSDKMYHYTDDSAYWACSDDEDESEGNEDVDLS
jgi:hypothetical protein